MKKAILALFLLAIPLPSVSGQNFSLHFDGEDDFNIFPNCEALTYPGFTIEGWFKCQPFMYPQVIMMSFLDIPDKNANVTLEVRETGFLRFNFRPVAVVLGGENLYSTTDVTDNVWHHFAAVKSIPDPEGGFGGLRLYIDGTLEVEKKGFYADINIPPIFEMGRNRYEATVNYRSFQGKMDDIKIWNRAKTSYEIFNEYQSESSGLEWGLFSNYKFDINSDTVYDCSANNKHGTRKGILGSNNLPEYSLDIPLLLDKDCKAQMVGVQDELKVLSSGAFALISPNPVLDIIKLELTETQKIFAEIYASDGRLVREITLAEKVNFIDVSAFPAGTYLIKLTNAKTTKAQRFLKI